MLGRLFHWIYCLPLDRAVLLALCATGAYLWLHHRLKACRWWYGLLAVMLIIWAGVVTGTTLLSRNEGSQQVWPIPFHTYITVLQGGEPELIRSAFMNVLLFYPAGLITGCLFRRWKFWPLLAFGAMSLAIELSQMGFHLGVFETDDILHNTLGVFLGILAIRQYEKNMQKTEAI